MKKIELRKLMGMLLLSVAMVTPQSVWAYESMRAPQRINLAPSDTQALEALLKACDGALTACEASLVTERELMRQTNLILEVQSERIAELESEANSFWSNPLPWIAVGVAAGLVTGVVISK